MNENSMIVVEAGWQGENTGSGYEYVSCDLCGKNDTRKILEAKDLYNKLPGVFSIVQCNNCGLVYTNPPALRRRIVKILPG